MTWGPKNSLQQAYARVSAGILETDPIRKGDGASLSNDLNGISLARLWGKCAAHANELPAILANIPGVIVYAKSQHPATYDIEAKWRAAQVKYAEICAEIEKLAPGFDGSEVAVTEIKSRTFKAADMAALRLRVLELPEVNS